MDSSIILFKSAIDGYENSEKLRFLRAQSSHVFKVISSLAIFLRTSNQRLKIFSLQSSKAEISSTFEILERTNV